MFRFIVPVVLLVSLNLVASGQPKPKLIKYEKGITFFRNARIVDVNRNVTLEGHCLLIDQGKIKSVGRPGELQVPPGAAVIDLEGKTILPGLVMLHEHMNYNTGAGVWYFHPVSFPKLFLAAGVTTLRTAGAENPMYDLNLKRQIDSGHATGPRMFVTGPMFNDKSGGFLGDFVISNYDEARKATALWAEKGCTSFKVYSDISREALKGVIDEARSRHLMVTGHLGKMSCTEAVELGLTNIEHGFISCSSDLDFKWEDAWNLSPEQKPVNDLVELLIRKNVVLTITPFSDSDFGDTSLMKYLSADEKVRIEKLVKDPPFFIQKESNDRKLRALEKLFISQGGKIVLGADAADAGLLPGFQNHNVMITMVKGGWTPLQVIKMATIDGAKFLGIEKVLGSLDIGKEADFLIINGKPDIDIPDIKNVELVFKAGIGYDPVALRERAKGLVGRY